MDNRYCMHTLGLRKLYYSICFPINRALNQHQKHGNYFFLISTPKSSNGSGPKKGDFLEWVLQNVAPFTLFPRRKIPNLSAAARFAVYGKKRRCSVERRYLYRHLQYTDAYIRLRSPSVCRTEAPPPPRQDPLAYEPIYIYKR